MVTEVHTGVATSPVTRTALAARAPSAIPVPSIPTTLGNETRSIRDQVTVTLMVPKTDVGEVAVPRPAISITFTTANPTTNTDRISGIATAVVLATRPQRVSTTLGAEDVILHARAAVASGVPRVTSPDASRDTDRVTRTPILRVIPPSTDEEAVGPTLLSGTDRIPLAVP